MKSQYRRLKYACYCSNLSLSVVANLPPVLFLTFRSLYGLSYSLLGLLVLVNYVTQLSVDLIFSFFSHRFNISKSVKSIPVLTFIGLLIYALSPVIFPHAVYAGLLIGTVIFSASGGLVEVLLSPVIAAIPSEDPDREMSKLHSVYAWGMVAIIVISTLFLLIFGANRWQILALIFMTVPLISVILFAGSKIPELKTPEKSSGAIKFFKERDLWLCVAAIFLGGCAETTMAQWSSGYLEQALAIPKVWGDIFGVAVFALMQGIGRSLYAKIGKNLTRVLLWGISGAAVCYFTAALSGVPVVGLLACALTGLSISMLWPGCLIVASDRFPAGGLFIFALMAAGGDLGASVGPQLTGIVTDAVIALPGAADFAQTLGLSADQLGLKCGMLLGALFPLIGIFVYAKIGKMRRKTDNLRKIT